MRAALTDLDRTVVVVSSKSGSTVETDSHRRAYWQAFIDAGIDPTSRIRRGRPTRAPRWTPTPAAAGFRVVLADPDVGGRYRALTAFGLVPAALAGAEVDALLDQAEAVADLLAADDDANPALAPGRGAGRHRAARDKLALVDDGTGIVGLGDWAEQLIAESTGKDGTGILPVVAIGAAPAHLCDDGTVVRLVVRRRRRRPRGCRVAGGRAARHRQRPARRAVPALGGRHRGRRAAARHQPVRPAQRRERQGHSQRAPRRRLGAGEDPAFTDGAVEVRTLGGDWLGDASTVDAAVDALLGQLDGEHGYLAVMAYLDRYADADLEHVARDLLDRTGRPVTFGWGPRFLHSTGQYHKGGPQIGVFLQVTGARARTCRCPGRDVHLRPVQAAQAAGDARRSPTTAARCCGCT